MLINSSGLQGLAVRATDGELGGVYEFYFDDATWAIRYFALETGDWSGGKAVLISPYSVTGVDWRGRTLEVALTKEQIQNSPDIDTRRPVSRQHEADYHQYYDYPFYWGGPNLWGSAFYPSRAALTETPETLSTSAMLLQPADCHLRSNQAVMDYSIEAADGEIGHLSGFIVDDADWAVRYIEVSTRNWWPGKNVLISPTWIQKVSWDKSSIRVGLTKDAIRSGPEYNDTAPITREYEERLHLHYGEPPYWPPGASRETFSLIDA